MLVHKSIGKGAPGAYYCPSLLTGSWHGSCRVSNNKLPTGWLQAVTQPHANNAGTTSYTKTAPKEAQKFVCLKLKLNSNNILNPLAQSATIHVQ